MPVFLERKTEIRLSLKGDESILESERPYFLFRPLTGRDVRFWTRCRRLAEKSTEGEQYGLIYRMLAVACIGWGNLKRPDKTEIKFPGVGWIEPGKDADAKLQAQADSVAAWLEIILTADEAGELLAGMELNAQDRKKSESPLSSAAESSATHADPAASA